MPGPALLHSTDESPSVRRDILVGRHRGRFLLELVVFVADSTTGLDGSASDSGSDNCENG